MTPIRLVSFDADDTLWDFGHMMRCGTEAVAETIVEEFGPSFGHLSADFLLEVYGLHARVHDPTRMPWRELRRRTYRDLLAEAGHPDPEAISYELLALYLDVWHANLTFYPGALETLAALQGRVKLGYISNGDNGPDIHEALGEFFDVVVTPAQFGTRKPDPVVFFHAAAIGGCALDEILHVGDSLQVDVGGAQAAGCRAAWFNPHGLPNQTAIVPDAEIRYLDEVPGLLV